jgi:hypothetical protein
MCKPQIMCRSVVAAARSSWVGSAVIIGTFFRITPA